MSTEDLVFKAAQFAKQAHAGQMRKYQPEPFIVHPARVAAMAMLLDGITPEEVAAGWLHDVIEDCPVTADDLRTAGFPERVVSLVVELTNPSKQTPELPRARRKEIDREHLAQVSRQAKRLKLLDRIDNLRGVRDAGDDFRSRYVAETVQLLPSLAGVDDELVEQLLCEIERLGYPRDYSDTRAG